MSLPPSVSPSANVRRTSNIIMSTATYVSIDSNALTTLVKKLESKRSPTSWDEHGWHYKGAPEQTALYVLVLDALNFCFWPSKNEALQYDHLAVALKKLCEGSEGDFRFSPARLAAMTVGELRAELDPLLPCAMPAIEERCRLLNELGDGLLLFWEGSALKMIAAANSSADALVHIISRSFPGFRDTCVSAAGLQCYFYKRAQIAVADLWAAFDHQSPCDFNDINKLTTFADYRVPQLLRDLNVMVYNEELSNLVDENHEILAGSAMELEIRAATIICVDRLVEETKKLRDSEDDSTASDGLSAIVMDWLLWQEGEKKEMAGQMKPHHKVRTIFY